MNVLLFDEICNLCNRLVVFVIKHDSHSVIHFASLQSTAGQSLIPSGTSSDTVVYLKNQRCFTKSGAVLELLYDLGGVWRFFYVFKLIPPCIRDAAYQFIAKRRYRIFGQRASCMVPSDDVKSRFL